MKMKLKQRKSQIYTVNMAAILSKMKETDTRSYNKITRLFDNSYIECMKEKRLLEQGHVPEIKSTGVMGLATAVGQDDGDEFEYDGEGFNFDD